MWGEVRRPAWLPRALPSRNLAPARLFLKWQIRAWRWQGGGGKGAAGACEFWLMGPGVGIVVQRVSAHKSTIRFISFFFFNENCAGGLRRVGCLSRPSAAASSRLAPVASMPEQRGPARLVRFFPFSLTTSIWSCPSKNFAETVLSIQNSDANIRDSPGFLHHSRQTPRKFALSGDLGIPLLTRCALAPGADSLSEVARGY